MMKVQAIIPTAGVGKRMRSSVAKPLVKIKGVPLFIHTLRVFERLKIVESVVLVVNKALESQIRKSLKTYKINKVKRIVLGGKTRQRSVYNGLLALDSDTDMVVIHDAARPCIEASLVEGAIESCRRWKAVTLAVPVKCTIKSADPKTLTVIKTLERSALWEIQTPQIFHTGIILKAHKRFKKIEVTDDAALVERLGERVKIIESNYKNIKVTTPEDLDVAAKFLIKPVTLKRIY